MKCVICRNGETIAGSTIFTFTDDETIVVVKDVPAKICDNCGEEYLDSETTRRLLDGSVGEVNHYVEVEVRNYVPIGEKHMYRDQRQPVEEFIGELGLASGQFDRKKYKGAHRLYVATASKPQPRFGSVRLYVKGQDRGKMVVYANGDFSDPEDRFTPQPKNPKDAWYKFWPDDKAARDYAVKVVKSAYASKA